MNNGSHCLKCGPRTQIHGRKKTNNPNPMNARCGLEYCDCARMIEKLVKALELVQWRGGDPGEDYCPVCFRDYCAGHEGDCIVGIAIKEAKS